MKQMKAKFVDNYYGGDLEVLKYLLDVIYSESEAESDRAQAEDNQAQAEDDQAQASAQAEDDRAASEEDVEVLQEEDYMDPSDGEAPAAYT